VSLLHGPVGRRLPRRTDRVHRGRRRAAALPVHHRRRAGDRLGGGGLHAVPARAPPDPDRRGAVMTTGTCPPDRLAADPGAVQRMAAAPISWGVCEVPGWGYQLAPARVLGEMRELGLAATELGP